MLAPAAVNDFLIERAYECRYDPLRFVLNAYPWGERGGPLENHPGPDKWQREILEYIRDRLEARRRGLDMSPIRIAVAGGVGPGKSALMAWILDWGITTMTGTKCRVTANTGPQLSISTWPEVVKWHRMSMWSPYFEVGDRKVRSLQSEHRENWFIQAVTWDEHNSEASRGFHNAGRRIILGMDEATGIATPIFRAWEGVLSGSADTEIIWIVLSNPTRTDTEFRTFFPGGRNDKLWKSYAIDTRESRMSDKAQIQEWIDAYGIDHDYVRVNVLSQFPRTGSTQFIGEDVVAAAVRREPFSTLQDPLVMGVDVARFGDDQTVVYLRRGRDGVYHKPIKYRGLDTQQVAARLAELNEQLKPNAIFIDEGGPGAGVVDRCRALQLPITGIDFGGVPDRSMVGRSGALAYYNKRAEMWGSMRDWLAGGTIADDAQLKAELCQVQYGYKLKDGKDCILLERKEDMKKRGLSSPDVADALALTFAYPVAYQDNRDRLQKRPMHQTEYDPFKGMFERAR